MVYKVSHYLGANSQSITFSIASPNKQRKSRYYFHLFFPSLRSQPSLHPRPLHLHLATISSVVIVIAVTVAAVVLAVSLAIVATAAVLGAHYLPTDRDCQAVKPNQLSVPHLLVRL